MRLLIKDQAILQCLLKKGLAILSVGPSQNQEFLKNVYKDVFEGKEHETEVRFPDVHGMGVIYSNHYKPAYSENKEIVAAVVTSRDITEKNCGRKAYQ